MKGKVTKDTILLDPYLAAMVRRYHTWPVTTEQTVGHHSHSVAMLVELIFGPQRAEVLRYCIWHDIAEVKVGDPPYPLKKENPVLKSEYDRLEEEHLEKMGITLPILTDWEYLRVKFCDLLDCARWGGFQAEQGNRYMRAVEDQKNGLSALLRKMHDDDRVKAQAYCVQYNIQIMWDSPVERRQAAE